MFAELSHSGRDNPVGRESAHPPVEHLPGDQRFPGPDPSSGEDAHHDDRQVLEEEQGPLRTSDFGTLAIREPAGDLPAGAQFRMSADLLLPLRHPVPHVQVLVDETGHHAARGDQVEHGEET